MDWSQCELVEVVPGKVSGVPLVVGTRIPADFIIENFEDGDSIEEIREAFPSLSEHVIGTLIQFAEQRRKATVA